MDDGCERVSDLHADSPQAAALGDVGDGDSQLAGVECGGLTQFIRDRLSDSRCPGRLRAAVERVHAGVLGTAPRGVGNRNRAVREAAEIGCSEQDRDQHRQHDGELDGRGAGSEGSRANRWLA